jgi:hypothetical protein
MDAKHRSTRNIGVAAGAFFLVTGDSGNDSGAHG